MDALLYFPIASLSYLLFTVAAIFMPIVPWLMPPSTEWWAKLRRYITKTSICNKSLLLRIAFVLPDTRFGISSSIFML